MLNWIRSLTARVGKALERFREWANDDGPPVKTVDRAGTVGVTIMLSPLGPPRVLLRVISPDGTTRVLVMDPASADLCSRQLKAAVYAACPVRSW